MMARIDQEWVLTGDTERARIVFSDDDRTQTISWEWKPAGNDGAWAKLCDRVARKTGGR